MAKKAFKVFNSDWTCRDKVYKVGKTYSMNKAPIICERGFHYCPKLINCFRYYDFDPKNKVAEVEVLGDIAVSPEGDKECTNKIKIVRELTWNEVLSLVNTGDNNSGSCNTGDCNTGDYNTGDNNSGSCNTGHRNTGYCNAGDYNTSNYNTGNYNIGYRNSGSYNTGYYNAGNFNIGGYNTGKYNTGDFNTGNYNTGDLNTGNYNTGSCNTGNYNSCNFSTGFFNSVEQPIYFFNKETTLTRSDLFNLKGLEVANRLKLSEWIYASDMTEVEKQQHPEYKTTGGYLKTYTYKQAWTNLWEKLDKDEKQAIKDLPNFDKEVFKEITGITVR